MGRGGSSTPFSNVKRLLAFFQTHPDETFSAEAICSATGILPGSLRSSFRILEQGHRQASRPSRGFYRWDTSKTRTKSPAPAPSPMPSEPPVLGAKIFELIGGPTSAGELVLQSDSGDLYLARKL